MPFLRYREIEAWPCLSWVANMDLGTGKVLVFHGSHVETRETWCAEMVWNLPFDDGDFDRTDCTLGSGIRLRENMVTFVSASDTINRLLYTRSGDSLLVSNSLAALLAVSGMELLDSFDYPYALNSITNGLNAAIQTVPASRDPIRVCYVRNLQVRGTDVGEVDKPRSNLEFGTYRDYREFLTTRAGQITANAGAGGRKHRVSSLATCSRGYDSPAVAVIAYQAGIRDAVTVAKARREPGLMFKINDSGAEIAGRIGLRCRSYTRHRRNYPHEDAIWAATGYIGDLNLTLFDYPGSVSLLWNGFMGDTLWQPGHFVEEPMARLGGASGLRFSEARLELGVLLCAPAFWAIYHEKQIQRISLQREMDPWRIGGDYDRPIPRRIIEEAGIPRGSFAIRKMASSFNRDYGAPLSRNLREDFFDYIKLRDGRPVTKPLEQLSLALRAFDSLALSRLPGLNRISCRNWIKLPTHNDFFLWANRRRIHRYRNHIEGTMRHQNAPVR